MTIFLHIWRRSKMSIREFIKKYYTKYRIRIQEIEHIAKIAEERKEKVRQSVEEYQSQNKK